MLKLLNVISRVYFGIQDDWSIERRPFSIKISFFFCEQSGKSRKSHGLFSGNPLRYEAEIVAIIFVWSVNRTHRQSET